MKTETETNVAIKTRNVKIKSNEVATIILPNGVSFVVSGVDCSVSPKAKPVDHTNEPAAVIETPPVVEAKPEAEATPVRRGGKGKSKSKSNDAPAESKGLDAVAKQGNTQSKMNFVPLCEAVGIADYTSKEGNTKTWAIWKAGENDKGPWFALRPISKNGMCFGKPFIIAGSNIARLKLVSADKAELVKRCGCRRCK